MSSDSAWTTLPGWDSPLTHDALGMLLHFVTIMLIYNVDGWHSAFYSGNNLAPALLIGQEIVAFIAHVVYTGGRILYQISDSRQNPWKWAEYSISATMGTIAALTISGVRPNWYWIVFMALTGAGQQSIGYQVDLPLSEVRKTNFKNLQRSNDVLFAESDFETSSAVTKTIKISFFQAVVLQVCCAR
jgi:hypothetical protein